MLTPKIWSVADVLTRVTRLTTQVVQHCTRLKFCAWTEVPYLNMCFCKYETENPSEMSVVIGYLDVCFCKCETDNPSEMSVVICYLDVCFCKCKTDNPIIRVDIARLCASGILDSLMIGR